MKEPSGSIDQGRNLHFVGNRRPVDEDDMTPHSEGRHGQSHVHGFFSGGSLRHKGSAGEHFGSVKLEDGAIDTGSKAKVVGVHDKSGHED